MSQQKTHPTKMAAAYQKLIADGQIEADAAQGAAVAALERLYLALQKYQSGGWLQKISLKKNAAPQGLYIYGAVGRGKSMLMDLFFALAPIAKKRRVHFHAFMQETHARIHEFRQANPKAGDPMPAVAKAIADEVTLLCFDELQVKDIADASILGRLFALLLEAGIVVVATSNRHPDELYKGGLNQHRFLPFIEFLKQRHDVHELAAERDFRLARLTAAPVWFTPCGPRARKNLDERFDTLTQGVAVAPVTLALKGRSLNVPRAAGGVARMGFDALCVEARGAGDYLALAARFHTLVLDNVPLLEPQKKNEAVRFVTLIDALYEAKVKLIASADGLPQKLYPSGDEAFEFERTVSRLMEMQSRDYLALPHISGPIDEAANEATGEMKGEA
jgi:cell division protein ZapE